MKPHVHREAIIAWANGSKIQVLAKENKGRWVDTETPHWLANREYRTKPVEAEWILCAGVRPPDIKDGTRVYWYGPKNILDISDVSWCIEDLDFQHPSNPILFIKIAKETE